MREWLIAAAAGYLLLLLSFVVAVAVLDRNHRRADRAVRVLRLLLIGAAPGLAGAVLKLHQAGLL
ncbi:hypothetical protein SAMN05421837_109387 [Amycolatopsis pretoriensis]|uniref:Uncharacterized protein n=1 Tax=Amycolatopsis pretoriensis TaxID=218821 RepID=A0A1H5RD08_9PSEU|nr:hypothetical protein [Amycolatopsis pretoriensis]SEF36229.1 hypothetical protein SAMN05421837_109387 [Amycolatopsis pretoriensis]